eukprot:TRINITY_DN9252_c0_g1_i1.p1 TRINITY_DN9252_c0_g1~~TRINITY_DN9252_c0_g1_i1.p1  ORF type:complete len:531 (+),score=92.03 TRINITY_DN9252_c0_g1_i1:76-1668(+)
MTGTAVIQGLKLGLGLPSLSLGLGLSFKNLLRESRENEVPSSAIFRKNWTGTEDEMLNELVKAAGEAEGTIDWNKVCLYFEGKNSQDCQQRWKDIHKKTTSNLWGIEEDMLLYECYQKHGSQWSLISKRGYLPGRTAKESCNRWQKVQRAIGKSTKPEEIERAIRILHGRELRKLRESARKKQASQRVNLSDLQTASTEKSAAEVIDNVIKRIKEDETKQSDLDNIKMPSLDIEGLKASLAGSDDIFEDMLKDIDTSGPPDPPEAWSSNSYSSASTVSCFSSTLSTSSVCSSQSGWTPKYHSPYKPSGFTLLPPSTEYSSGSLSAASLNSFGSVNSLESSIDATSTSSSAPLTSPVAVPSTKKMSETVKWLFNGPAQPAGAPLLPTYCGKKKSKLLTGFESAFPKTGLTVSPEMRMDLVPQENSHPWLSAIAGKSSNSSLGSSRELSPVRLEESVWMRCLEPYKCVAKTFLGVQETSWISNVFSKRYCPWSIWQRSKEMYPPQAQSCLPSSLWQFYHFRVALPFMQSAAM